MGDGFPAELRARTCGKDYQLAMVVVEALELVEVEREAVELVEAWRKKKKENEGRGFEKVGVLGTERQESK